MCMCTYMCMHMSIHMSIHLSTHMSTRMSTHMSTHVSTSMSTHMSIYTHVYTPVYTQVYTHVYTHVYTRVYTCVYTHVYTHGGLSCRRCRWPVHMSTPVSKQPINSHIDNHLFAEYLLGRGRDLALLQRLLQLCLFSRSRLWCTGLYTSLSVCLQAWLLTGRHAHLCTCSYPCPGTQTMHTCGVIV